MTELDLLLRTLASPTRLRILAILRKLPEGAPAVEAVPSVGEMDVMAPTDRSPSVLATRLGIARSTASQHLKILLRMGLIRYRKKGVWKHYALARPPEQTLRASLLERLVEEMPNDLEDAPCPPSRRNPAERRSRPRKHSGVTKGPLAPVWEALTAFSNFRRLLLLDCLLRDGAVSTSRLARAMDLSEKTARYHVRKLLRRGLIEKSAGGVTLAALPGLTLAAFLRDTLDRELSGRRKPIR